MEETSIQCIDRLYICDDCLYYHMGWLDSFDCYYSPEEAKRHIEKCGKGFDRYEYDLQEKENIKVMHHYVETNKELEFSRSKCDICDSKLHGRRHALDVMGVAGLPHG